MVSSIGFLFKYNRFLKIKSEILLVPLFEQRESHRFALGHISMCYQARHVAHPADIVGAFRHADGASCIKEIKNMRALQAIVVAREHQTAFIEMERFGFEQVEKLKEHLNIGFLEIVSGPFHFPRWCTSP